MFGSAKTEHVHCSVFGNIWTNFTHNFIVCDLVWLSVVWKKHLKAFKEKQCYELKHVIVGLVQEIFHYTVSQYLWNNSLIFIQIVFATEFKLQYKFKLFKLSQHNTYFYYFSFGNHQGLTLECKCSFWPAKQSIRKQKGNIIYSHTWVRLPSYLGLAYSIIMLLSEFYQYDVTPWGVTSYDGKFINNDMLMG